MTHFIRRIAILLFVAFSFTPVAYANTDGQTHTPKKWTFMIFLNGNNNLDYFAQQNLKSLEQVGSNENVNIIVQWASLESHTVKRLYIEKSTDPEKVTSPVIEDLGSVDMGDYKSLEGFIKWTVDNYPAEHYFVDVWDHGSGWSRKRSLASRDISYDDLTGNHIKTEQLGLAMAYAKEVMGHNVDIYGSDACLMAMIEVAGQMADSVDYFVGSQELEPGEGWPYKELMEGWEAKADITPKEVSKLLVDVYVAAYSGGVYGYNDATMSALDLSRLPGVYKSLAKYSKLLGQLSPSQRQALLSAVPEVQAFGGYAIIDLYDLLKHAQSLNLSGVDQKTYEKLYRRLNNLVIANKDSSNYKNAHGLSIWFPTYKGGFTAGGRDERYKNLAFNAKTHWGEMLDGILQGEHEEERY